MALQLIVNADDFGFCEGVNAAVVRAHASGTLTSASLMVTAKAAREAVSIAKDSPDLAVGLHLALSRAKSALTPEAIPALVDAGSNFSANPVAASLRYFFSPSARRQLALEIEAQFETFAAFGLRLSHVDGHQHLHAHPVVLPIVIRLAHQYGASGIRVPKEPLLAGLAIDRTHPFIKIIDGLAHAYLSQVCRANLRDNTLNICSRCIGGLQSGRMTDHYAIKALDPVRTGCTEIYFHPCTRPSGEPLGPNPGDLAALTSPRFKAYITARYELATYQSLKCNTPEASQ